MPPWSPSVDQARETLLTLIRIAGLNPSKVSDRLKKQNRSTDTARVLLSKGVLELKLRHVVDICAILEIEPLEFFEMVYKEPKRPSPLVQRLREMAFPSGSRARTPIELGQLAALARQILEAVAAWEARDEPTPGFLGESLAPSTAMSGAEDQPSDSRVP